MISIVYSSYYQEIALPILDSIMEKITSDFDQYGQTLVSGDPSKVDVNLYEVSGVWEIPYTINSLTPHCRYFIAVGAVVKGETDHYEYISNSVSNALMNITINKDVYISNCILNLHTIEQGVHRSTTKGLEAVEALLNVLNSDNVI